MKPPTGPAFTGDADCDYGCGSCGTILAKNITQGMVKNIVVRCPKCGKYNEFP